MTPKKSTFEGRQQKIQEIEEKPRALDQPVSERPGRPSGPDEASSLLEALFNVIPDIIGIQDSDHKIIRYNKAGYRFLNRSQEEVAGRKCYELIGRDSPCEVCATTETYRTKRSARVERYFDELGVWFDVRSYPILNKDGDEPSILCGSI